mmetsp:Transcript_56293/g.64259  ORF Transcript_56293/g.64259 Transcript_56293/m.64259 type:complete len:245 (-) Transcript_56293:4-738(-)
MDTKAKTVLLTHRTHMMIIKLFLVYLTSKLNNSVDHFTIGFTQSLNGLRSAAAGVLHDHVDGFGVETSLINFFVVIFFFFLLINLSLGFFLNGGLTGGFGFLEFLGFFGQVAETSILEFGLTKDDITIIISGRLHNIGVLDDEVHVLSLLEGNSVDSGHGLHSQFGHGLSALLLTTVLLSLGFTFDFTLRVGVMMVVMVMIMFVIVIVVTLVLLDLSLFNLLIVSHFEILLRFVFVFFVPWLHL